MKVKAIPNPTTIMINLANDPGSSATVGNRRMTNMRQIFRMSSNFVFLTRFFAIMPLHFRLCPSSSWGCFTSPHWVILSRSTKMSIVIMVGATQFILTLLPAAGASNWPRVHFS